MRIYILPVDKQFQPKGSRLEGPPHNVGYTIEKDFLNYLENSDMLTSDPNKANWHYLPIFWTYWNLNHNYGKDGKTELKEMVDRATIDKNKTFTVCQYDGGPGVDIGKTKLFLSAKTSEEIGIDVPPLVKPHKHIHSDKKYLASFVGKTKTHPIRKEMFDDLGLNCRRGVYLEDRSKGEDYFVKTICESDFTLCPRGSAGNSFRFFEAMQLGSIPILISDIDTRPFKKFIPWDDFSFYVKSMEELHKLLDELMVRQSCWISMISKKVKQVWKDCLWNQNWCKYVIKELELFEMEKRENQDFKFGGHRAIFCNVINKFNLKTGVELGVWFGNHSQKILENTKVEKLYGVDPYLHDDDHKYELSLSQPHLDKILEMVSEKLKPFKNRFQLIKQHSHKAVDSVPNKVDFVFIDADHSYEFVKRDIQTWFHKVNKGGIIGGHDYGHKSFKGVKHVVDEFFNSPNDDDNFSGYKINVEKYGVWWVQK